MPKLSHKLTHNFTRNFAKGKTVSDLISNFDIYKYVSKSVNIVESSRLHEQTYDQLLNNQHGCSVILIQNSDNTGHWVLINKAGNVVEYFDSYGCPYEESDIAFLKKHLGLTKVVSNKTQFQRYSSQINTCGKHVLFRLLTLLEFKMDLKQHTKFVNDLCKKMKETADELVTVFVTLT